MRSPGEVDRSGRGGGGGSEEGRAPAAARRQPDVWTEGDRGNLSKMNSLVVTKMDRQQSGDGL